MTHAKPVRIVFMVLISLAVVSLCGCKKHGSSEPEATRPATDTTALIVMQATRCARLYTTEYKIHKVVTHEDVRRLKGRILSIPVDMNLSVGSRKAAIPIDVTLKAYIDFAGFDAGHVQRDSNRIVIILPAPVAVPLDMAGGTATGLLSSCPIRILSLLHLALIIKLRGNTST